ncbi:MAG TPA: SPOR domain-containing protein [Allosphingosinicella sp.]|nr:SPOR domain-containing protein [Allosphingosinicella sp.]
MTSLRRGVRLGLAVLGAGTMFTAAPGSAQTGAATGAFTERPQQALSRNLRSLAANPKSVTALMGAGKAALELGDPQAALTFFARAEEQTPRDGRVKMWIATALVQLQQPHAALKFFRDSTDLGVPAAEFARDRGLAHDIAGNPREAQRDYRLALTKGRDDEATRRLALSLAISGEREPALRLLEDQLLVRDRSAERARALVLALTGDAAGATRAVQSAMPGPQAGAMSPFLARLPGLAPADRALAVHLGVFPRDGRTGPPATYAANDFANAVTDAGRPDPSRGSLARRSPPPEPVSTAEGRRPGSEGGLAPAVRRSTRSLVPVARPVEQQSSARARLPSRVVRGGGESSGAETLAGVRKPSTASRPSPSPGFGGVAPAWSFSRGLAPGQQRRRTDPPAKPSGAATTPARVQTETAIAAATPAPVIDVPKASVTTPATVPPSSLPLQQQPQPAEVRVATVEPSASPVPQPSRSEPALQPSEVRIATVEPSAPPFQQPFQLAPKPKPAEVRIAAVEPSATPPQPQPQSEPQPQPAEVQFVAVEPSAPAPQSEGIPTGSRLADLSATLAEIAEPKPARTSAPKPKPAAKPATAPAKKPKAEPAEASRLWVQVAGGAAKAALPREFARLKAKAPKLLGARSAWTAPLNATNRLLVGPFASAREAQAFVNQLKSEDLSGFAWTSPAGQKVEKLSAR